MQQKWSLFKESGRWVIRRWVDGKNKRLPVRQYRHIREDEEELKAFVHRLNAPLLTAEAVTFKHAFISPKLMDEYLEVLLARVPNERNARCQHKYLVRYFLNYFIGTLGLPDPKQWFMVHKSKWATYLLSDEVPKSVSTKRKIIQAANTFMEWLAERRPDEYTAIKFKPISRSKFDSLSATESMVKGRDRFLREKDWKVLEKKLPANIKSVVSLCYYYGLRRSEALGLRLDDVRKEYLKVERQNLIVGQPAILKGKKKRKTPHWYLKPSQAYALIEAIVPMSPDSVADEWAKLKTGFNLHDLRATFITRALRDHKAREVQLAVGHKQMATTDRYADDHRDFGDDIWLPGAA